MSYLITQDPPINLFDAVKERQMHPTKAQIDADPRVAYLTGLCLSLRPDVTSYGEVGFMQMAWGSTATAAWRRRRAARLLQARRAKLFNGCAIGKMLAEASEFRLFERGEA